MTGKAVVCLDDVIRAFLDTPTLFPLFTEHHELFQCGLGLSIAELLVFAESNPSFAFHGGGESNGDY